MLYPFPSGRLNASHQRPTLNTAAQAVRWYCLQAANHVPGFLVVDAARIGGPEIAEVVVSSGPAASALKAGFADPAVAGPV